MYCFKGVKGEFLVATKFFQVSCHFSMIFIKFFKIPYFQVFHVYSHFSRFSRSSGSPESRSRMGLQPILKQPHCFQWEQDRNIDADTWCKRALMLASLCQRQCQGFNTVIIWKPENGFKPFLCLCDHWHYLKPGFRYWQGQPCWMHLISRTYLWVSSWSSQGQPCWMHLISSTYLWVSSWSSQGQPCWMHLISSGVGT